MKAKKRAITARPRALSDEIATREPTEEGLSIDPEEMGQSFLRYATEQGNAETIRSRAEELLPGSEPASDEALEGPNFSPEGNVWKNTVDMVVGTSDIDDVTSEADPPDPDTLRDDFEARLDAEERTERGVIEVDLTENVIDEADLLDEESDVLGEVIVKEPRTDDGPDAKRR